MRQIAKLGLKRNTKESTSLQNVTLTGFRKRKRNRKLVRENSRDNSSNVQSNHKRVVKYAKN